jgi:hypothetical protein
MDAHREGIGELARVTENTGGSNSHSSSAAFASGRLMK